MHRYVNHDGRAGAVARPVHEAVNVLGQSFEDGLDPAVGKVAHPPAHTVFEGDSAAGVPEEDTLNLTGDHHPTADHKQPRYGVTRCAQTLWVRM
jgi:hypothetical protein